MWKESAKQTNLLYLHILELFGTRVDLTFRNCEIDHILEIVYLTIFQKGEKAKKNDNHVSKKNLKKRKLTRASFSSLERASIFLLRAGMLFETAATHGSVWQWYV